MPTIYAEGFCCDMHCEPLGRGGHRFNLPIRVKVYSGTLAQATIYALSMDVTPTGCPGCTGDHAAPTTTYRVVLWEQPDFDDVPPENIGWGEAAFDLTGADDVRQVIDWAEEQLASGAGYHSQAGQAVRDREYVIYAKAPGAEDLLVQIAGWDPSRNPRGANLPRLRRHS